MGLEPITGEVKYTVDTDPIKDLITALDKLEEQTSRMGDAFEKQGKQNEESAKRTLDVGAALKQTSEILGGLTSAFQSALSSATAFGSEMGQVATLSSEVRGNMQAYQEQVLALSATMGVEATQAANTMYEALSSGAATDAAGAMTITEVAMKAAVGGATDAATAIDGITTSINAWKLGSDEAGRVSDVLFKAVAVGKMTFGELSGAMFQAGPLAASLGVELEEVAAAATTITKSGAPVNVAMTQVRSAMTALLTPGEELQTVFDRLQKQYPEMAAATGQAALDAFGFHKTLALVREESEGLGMALPTVMGRIEAVGATLALTGQNAEGAVSDLDAMRNSAGETEAAYGVMSETFGAASDRLKSSTNAVMVELGTTLGQMLVPALQKATEIAQGLLEGWQSLDDGTKQMIVTIGGLLALIGSGIGVFLTLQSIWTAIGPIFATSAGGIGLAGAAIMGLVVAIGALVKGAHDLNAAYADQYEKVQTAKGGLDAYMQATIQAQQNAGALGKTWAFLTQESIRQDLQIVKAGESMLRYSANMDPALMKSAEFRLASQGLAKDLAGGRITQEQYNQQLYALADATSVAADKGHILSQAQQETAKSFADSIIRMGEQTGWLDEGTLKSEKYQEAVQRLSESYATGNITQAQATEQLMALGEAMDQVAAATQAQAEAQAQAEGTMKSYSAGFQELFSAGSQWVADTGAMTAKIEESWNSLSGGIQKNLDEQWTGWQQYQTDLAAAREADAAAAAGAAQKRADAEAGHVAKMEELDIRAGEAKTDRQKRAAEQAIAKENEKLAGILAATESVGGANVAKVQEQYNQQVAAQREALAQMIVDHVNSMVLMGQTSEETAKTIFATLRDAYPGVEVLSPVADAHAELMGTIRDATDESSAGQVEAIARLPEALDGALGLMQETSAEYTAEMDTWKTADEQLAQSAEESSTRRQAATTAATETGVAAAETAMLSDAQLSEAASQRATGTEEAMGRETTARTQTADDTEAADQRITDSSSNVASTVATDAQSIEGSSGVIGAGYQMAADEVENAATRITTGLANVSSNATAITSSTANFGGQVADDLRAVLPPLGEVQAGFKTTEKNLKDAKGTAAEMGTAQERSFEQGGTAATRAGDDIETSMDTSKVAMAEAQTQTEDLTEALELIPDIITIDISARGFKGVVDTINELIDAVKDLQFIASSTTPPGSRGGPPGTTPPPARDDSALPTPPGDMAPPISDSGGWSDWSDSMHQAEADFAKFVETTNRGFEVNAYYQPDSPAVQMTPDGLGLTWAIKDLYESTADPVVVVMTFDASQFDDDLAAANEALRAAQAEADRLNERLQATYDTFISGGDSERGSMAWLFREWGEEDFFPNFEDLMKGMNLPIKDMAEFQKYWDTLGPEEQADTWKRLYEDLKRLEKERHDARIAELKDELQTAQENGKELYAEQLEDRIREENEDYERNIDLLEERDRLIKRQNEDYKDGVKDVTEATRELAAVEKELERARQEHIRAQIQRLKDEQKAAEEYETTAHERVLELLDDEEKQRTWLHEQELARIQALMDAEDERHNDVIAKMDVEKKALDDYIDAQERRLKEAKLDLEDWIASIGLDEMKADLKAINDAIRDLPSGRDLVGGRGKGRPKPEDTVRVDLTQGQKDVLAEGLASGAFSEEDARRAQVAIQTGRLRLDYLRKLLEYMQKISQQKLADQQAEIDAKKAEYEADERHWEREKLAIQDRLDGIEERRRIENERHEAEVKNLEGLQTAEQVKYDAEMQHLEDLRKAEEDRHDARMKQLEEEYLMAIMIAEGLSPNDAAAKLAELRANVQKAREEAEKILAELPWTGSVTPSPPPGGGGTITPGPIVPPGGGIEPPPPPGTTGYEDLAAGAGALDMAMGEAAMTLKEFLGMLPTEVMAGAGSGGIAGGALLTSGDTIKTDFWGPVIIADDAEAERLLRKSLGGGWDSGGGV